MVNAGNAEELAAFWALLGTTVSARFDQFVWLKPALRERRSWPSRRSLMPPGTAAAAP